MASAPLNWLARIGGAVLNTRHSTLIADALNEINRQVPKTVVFAADGTITETYSDGYKVVTTFVSDSVITEQFYKDNVLYTTKTTTFAANGDITETYVDAS